MPADPSQTTHQTFAGGLNESQRDEVTSAETFLVLKNTRQDKRGGYSKRNGFTPWSSLRIDATTRSAGYRLMAYGNQPVVIDGHVLDARSSATGTWRSCGRVPECTVERVPMPFPGGTALYNDVVYVNGYFVLVSAIQVQPSLTFNIVASVVDATTYAVVAGPTVVTSGGAAASASARVVASGNNVLVAYASGSTVTGKTLDVTSATTINTGWSSATTMVSADMTGGVHDVHGLEDRFVVAYANVSGGINRLTVKTFHVTTLANLETSTATLVASTPSVVSLAGTNADTLWVSWAVGTTNAVIGLTGNALASVKATLLALHTSPAVAIRHAMLVTGVGTGRLLVSSTAGAGPQTAIRSFVTTAGAVAASGAATLWNRMAIVARPFTVDSRDYCALVPVVSTGAASRQCLFIADVTEVGSTTTTTLRVVGNIAPRISLGSPSALVAGTAHVAAISATKFAVVNVVTRAAVNTATGAAVELAILDFANSNRWQPSALAGNTHLSGGVGTYFDGVRVRETSFLVRPDAPIATNQGGTGITATAIKFVAVYEKVDAAGNIEQSAPSDPSNAVTPANNDVNVTCFTLVPTQQTETGSLANPVRIAIYRSSANGATPYYRDGFVDNIITGNTAVYNTATNDVTTNAKLYTQAGVAGTAQVRSCPPASTCQVAYNGMLVCVGDDTFTLWYSGQQITGEGVWFSDIFQVPITEGGAITALGVLDSSLYAFKRRAIFSVDGSAPSDNGASGGLGQPRRVASDVGCIEPRSICSTAIGIFFQSERGIELLDRSLSVSWIGEAVMSTLATYPVITSATLDAVNSVVIFTTAATETLGVVGSYGPRLVFDLSLKQWVSTDEVTGSFALQAAQSACILYTGSAYKYAWMTSGGIVHYENATHLDNESTWVPQVAETGNFHPAGLQGWMQLDRVIALMQRHTAHDLTATFYYNYGLSASSDTLTFSAATLTAMTLQQVFLSCGESAKCQSVRVRLADATPTSGSVGTGQGGTWVGLTWEHTIDRGSMRLPDTSG